ncbi:MAG: DUF2791 family P-loop domain-containing protein [Trueperaceae bacterium]|nr:MAG: DUF2791 family P-loop domain-containing protein [Trueperaceae bacterium]
MKGDRTPPRNLGGYADDQRTRQYIEALTAYVPADRLQAMARGEDLPDRTSGAALFADISGFTPLTEGLTRTLGPLHGAEELSRQLLTIYTALIAEVNCFGGSVIGFSGDAITCWFDKDDGSRASASALAIQTAMARFASVPLPDGGTASLAVKVAVVTGPVRRFVVGNPGIQVIDVLAGRTLDLLAAGEHLAERGEVVVADTVPDLEQRFEVTGWRYSEEADGARFALLSGKREQVPESPWSELPVGSLNETVVRTWLLPPVYQRLRQGPGQFLASFRPAAALFLSFTGIEYDHDREAGAKLDAYVRYVQSTVDRLEGAIIQLTIGDKGSYLYAAFGAPVAHDDDAARAVAAALVLSSPPKEFDYIHSVRIGLAHGHMYAGAYGSPVRSTFGVLSNKTNLSARLMGKAEIGGILCDEEIYRHARRTWAFEALTPIFVKGKEEAVPIFAPTGETAKTPKETETKPEAQVVGRDADIARLQEALDELVAGKSRVQFIEGEAGIGKSTLASVLVGHAISRNIAVLRGAGQSVEQQTPYRAWRDVFSSYFGLEDTAEQHERQIQVQSVVEQIAPAYLERLPVLNDILALGLPDTPLTAAFEPSVRQENLVDFLLHLLTIRAKEGPLVLVLEDAHWLDSLSWDLTVQFGRTLQTTGEPVLMTLVSRPLDPREIGAAPTKTLRELEGTHTVELTALSPEATVALVANRLGLKPGTLPEVVAELVRERAGGNPFFAEELVQTFLEQELISVEIRDGVPTCVVSEALKDAELTLPDTLQGMILARIDRLTADRQLTLKVASVIGRIFASAALRDTLSRFTEIEIKALRRQLRELTNRVLILLEIPDPELTYIFRHIITHEVVYQSLLFAQRREVHLAVGEWFEETHVGQLEDHYPILAYHFGNAAEGAGDLALTTKAVDYLSRNGRQLTQLCAYPEAVSAYRRALELLPQTVDWAAQRADLLVQLGLVYEKMSDYPLATECLEDGLRLANQAEESTVAVEALTGLCLVFTWQGSFTEAERSGKEALLLAQQSRNQVGAAGARSRLGIVAAYQGDFTTSVKHFEAALDVYRGLSDLIGISRCLNNLGSVVTYQGDYLTARRYFEQSLEIDRQRGDRDAIGKVLANLGNLAEKQRDYQAAHAYFEESLAIFQEINSRRDVVENLTSLGNLAIAQDETAEAQKHYQEALNEALALGALPAALLALTGIAWVLSQQGQLQWAAELLGFAKAHPARNPDFEEQAESLVEFLENNLSSELLTAAIERGQKLDLYDVIRTLQDT